MLLILWMFIDIVDILFWIAYGQISSTFDRVISEISMDFSPNLVCALIWWSFRIANEQISSVLMKLSAHNMIMAGYRHFPFLCFTQK